MKPLKAIAQFTLLVLGAMVTVATSDPGGGGFYTSDEWVVDNLYDGQTAAATDIEIRLNLGTWDFDPNDGEDRKGAARALKKIRLYPEGKEDESVSFDLELDGEDSLLIPYGLRDDTDYVLDLEALSDSVESDRIIPEPIHFRTGSLPRVTGLWRNSDTLLITFSEPMNREDLFLGRASVDLFWQDDDELKSVVGDLNLADFAVQVDERLFMVAPVDFLDGAWVKVSGMVAAASGETLDGDGDGEPNGAGDDFLAAVQMSLLPVCYTREDIPAPCVAEEEIPDELRWM